VLGEVAYWPYPPLSCSRDFPLCVLLWSSCAFTFRLGSFSAVVRNPFNPAAPLSPAFDDSSEFLLGTPAAFPLFFSFLLGACSFSPKIFSMSPLSLRPLPKVQRSPSQFKLVPEGPTNPRPAPCRRYLFLSNGLISRRLFYARCSLFPPLSTELPDFACHVNQLLFPPLPISPKSFTPNPAPSTSSIDSRPRGAHWSDQVMLRALILLGARRPPSSTYSRFQILFFFFFFFLFFCGGVFGFLVFGVFFSVIPCVHSLLLAHHHFLSR